MRIIRCPHCDEPLPGFAKYCAVCGSTLPFSPANDARAFNARSFFATDNRGQENIRVGEHGSTTETVKFAQRSARLRHNSTIPMAQGPDDGDYTLNPEDYAEDFWEFRPSGNWHKVVPSRTSHMPVQLPVTPAPILLTSPTQRPAPPARALLTPLPTGERRRPPVLFVVSLLLLGAVIAGGVLGVVVTLGRGALAQKSHSTAMTLQVTPASVALGAIITLRGSNFSPLGRIGLSRDSNIPVFDTANNSIIQADSKGAFTDTVMVDAQWLSGTHILHAEDAHLHKMATFPILVTGLSPSLRPAHLLLSSNTLSLGSGDQATNSTRTITLTNAGGGQISWQTTTTQPWLLLSPRSGTFSSGQSVQVTVAADRTNLSPGAYTAQAIFSTDVGQMSLPVSMQTTPLEVGHEPVLQLTPAVLAFSSADGGNNPPAQVVTVSNPGALPLQWNAVVSAGNSWLTISPSSSTVAKGGSESVLLGINSSAQLPGTYSASVTFFSTGDVPTRNSPQSIYVSLTIVPQCALQVSPGMLSFTAVDLQPAPAAKTISLNDTQGCSAQLQWNAATTGSASWLSLGATSGTTPSYPSVGVASAGLQPGTYTAGIIFSTATGTQTLPVTLIIGQPTTPLIATTPASMAFTAIVGQPNPSAQSMTIANSGGGVLAWQAAVSTTSGGSWLSLSSGSGTLAANQSATVTIQPNLLSSLTPNTYSGLVTISGVDGSGNPANGGPQTIPVSFTVLPACTIAGTPAALTFTGVFGQSNPATQNVTLSASGTCIHTLNWTASIIGASWLNATPDRGTVSLSSSVSSSISVSLAGLPTGTVTGHVIITAVDSVTHRSVGTPQSIAVTLTVQPPCTLQAPSLTGETFSSETGHNPKPTSRSFSIGIIGTCVGNITITPTTTQSWLTVSPSSATITAGRATFTLKVASALLAAGTFSDTVSIAAVTSGGLTINGSAQTVGVALTVVVPPSLSVGQGTSGLTINDATGIITQALSINNGGGTPLNWRAKLASNAPSFVTLSARGGSNLAGGNGITDNVIANVTGIPGGSSFTTSVTITAIDPLTGKAVAGSPIVVPITINVAPPLMVLNATALTYTTTVGVNPSSQSVLLTNAGGDGLTWTAGTPSQPWLTIGLTRGSDNANATSTIPFTVNVTGLASGSYTATVVITPSVGTAQTVTVTLTVN